MIKNVDGNNLGTVWEKVAELVKKLTGDVELPKGNLQEQILNHTHDNRYYTENEIDEKLGEKLLKTGDSKDLTTTFTSQDSTNVTQWTDVGVLQSGEKHSSMFQKISTMFKNIRYLYHMLGTADISTLGEGADIGTVTGALSKLNSDMTVVNSNLNTVVRIYNGLIAAENVAFRDMNMYNSIFVFGKLVMISFSVVVLSDIINGQMIATLPNSLQGKIEWNNLCGATLNNRCCPFVFSDNTNDILIRTDNMTIVQGDEIRVWGIGFSIN